MSCKQVRAGQPRGLGVGERKDKTERQRDSIHPASTKEASSPLHCVVLQGAQTHAQGDAALLRKGCAEGQPSSRAVPGTRTKPLMSLGAAFTFLSPAACGAKEHK